jgi:hypothetical protein
MSDPLNLSLQGLIDSGMAWKLEGHIGRQAMAAIESGHCVLGETAHFDYYGNRVPSRTEVKKGSLGSLEYADEFHDPEQCWFCYLDQDESEGVRESEEEG